MPFSFDDLIETLGLNQSNPRQTELMQSEIASAKAMTKDEAKLLFPSMSFSESNYIAYVPMKMCHSLPSVNKKGRCFTPQVLHRSVASAKHSLIDFDHILKDHGNREDAIIGHIMDASFNWELQKELASVLSIPAAPVPMYALGALFMRHPKVQSIIKGQNAGRPWKTSMECEHNWSDAALYYEGELIPVKEAASDMRECVKQNQVLPYKGKPMAVALGGINGSVDFWGLALTQSPADDETEVLSIMTAAKEVASVGQNGEQQKKKFFALKYEIIPTKGISSESLEDAVDKRINEQASISIIGKTEPAEDGHFHEVLSDGTILPAQGHVHYSTWYSIVRGTNPRYTGRTDTQTERNKVDEYGAVTLEGKTHMHLINIPLRGKAVTGSGEPMEDDVDSEVSNISPEDEMKVNEILANLQKVESAITLATTQLSTGKSGEQASVSPALLSLSSELASLRQGISSLSKDDEIKDGIKKEIANMVASGELIEKEELNKKIEAMKTELEKKHEADRLEQNKRQERINKLVGIGLNLEAAPWDDEPGVTIKEKLEKFPVDAIGDQLFNSEFRYLNTLAQSEKERLAEEEAAKAGKNTPAASAASVTKPAAKKPLLVGATAGTETASDKSGGKAVGKARLLAVR